MRISMRLPLLPLLLGLALAGCSILPESPPQDIYRLPAPALTAGAGETVDVSLRIERPAASDLLRSARIAVVPDDNRVSVYRGARWTAPVPVLWRDHVLEAFRSDGRIRWLSGDNEGLYADRELGGVLRAFHAEYRDGAPTVVVQFDARLVDPTTKRIIASRRFSAEQAVAGKQLPEVVAAFGRAADALARELIDWTVEALR